MGKAPATPKEILIKSKLYKFSAAVFAIFGVFLFVILYIQQVEGDLLRLFSDVRMISIFLVPFLPAAVLSILSQRLERKYLAMIEKKSEDGEDEGHEAGN